MGVINTSELRAKVLRGGFVHSGEVGGGEHVHGRALGELLQQRAGCGGVQFDFGIGILFFVLAGDVGERFFKAGGSGNGDVFGLGERAGG